MLAVGDMTGMGMSHEHNLVSGMSPWEDRPSVAAGETAGHCGRRPLDEAYIYGNWPQSYGSERLLERVHLLPDGSTASCWHTFTWLDGRRGRRSHLPEDKA